MAKALGVKEENLIVNGLPKDTKEEAEFTKSIVGDEPFILVTSATHMPRAMMLFESLGLNPIPAPTNFHKNEFKSYFKAPDVGSFYKSKIAIHEYIGILWSKIREYSIDLHLPKIHQIFSKSFFCSFSKYGSNAG